LGAETSATHLIFFIMAMILAASVAGVVYVNVNAIKDATNAGGNTLSKQLKTDITIINDPGNIPSAGNVYSFYVKNTGKTNLAQSQVTVIINGIVIPDADVNKTVIVGSSVWRPTDVLQLDVTYASMPAENNIRVITENGIEDTLDFKN
jgi:flagellar protein FlaG